MIIEERKKELEKLEEKIEYSFKNKDYLDLALVHSSFAYEKNSYSQNERLEFLGDVVLNLIISEYIYHLYPKKVEGDLAKIRSSLVNKNVLAKVAKRLFIGKHLLLGKGEESTGGRNRNSILGNTLEAIIGAIYLDGGFKEAQRFVILQIKGDIELLEKDDKYNLDSKTTLQEITQEKFKVLPEYKVVSIKGPDHKKMYEVDVLIDNKIFGFGVGRSKKEAEQKAALMAIKKFEKGIN